VDSGDEVADEEVVAPGTEFGAVMNRLSTTAGIARWITGDSARGVPDALSTRALPDETVISHTCGESVSSRLM